MISAYNENIEKYKNNPLFLHCIEITVPPGFVKLFDELVQWLENYNKKQEVFIGFAQIKMKFGLLTIYVEHYTDDHHKWREEQKSLGWPDYYKIRAVQEHIADVCEKSRSVCKVCGKQKTEIVVDSKVQMACFEHLHTEKKWWETK